jgi:hypothetical protein
VDSILVSFEESNTFLILNSFSPLQRYESQLSRFVSKLRWIVDGDNKWNWRSDRNLGVRSSNFKLLQSLTLSSLFSPYLVGVLTPNRSLSEWRIVFWIAFVVFNVTNIVYIIWASGEVQPFNDGYVSKASDQENASTSEEEFEPPMKKIEDLKRDSLK